MAKISLKNIVGKKSETTEVLTEYISRMNTPVCIEDDAGKVLLGNLPDNSISYPVIADNETIGFVKGSEAGAFIAGILSQLAQKESEKKKLGAEVLSLYQEINVIFNFSEKLSQTIDPGEIAKITMEQAMHSIPAHSGVIVLWDDDKHELDIPAAAGEPLFNTKNISSHVNLLLRIALSGQSEIITDLSSLKEKRIIEPSVQSLVYASMKVKHRIMGAIILAATDSEKFSAGNLKMLVTLALQSSAAIESAMLYERNIREVKEREEAILRIHEVTKKFVPNEFIRSLGKETLTDVRLGDQTEKIVTVLFTDIRDFTTLSEKMTPEQNFQFVSSFNARLGPVIRSNKGFINQYLGDSIMAIFPEKPEDALQAAIQMQQAVHLLNVERAKDNLAPIKAGIGMHTGPLIMGITGDEHRMDAATISDTVNTAARIESLTKHYRSPLLLSDETLQRIEGADRYHLRQLGSVKLKGKNNLLTICECINGFSSAEIKTRLNTLAVFNKAMQAYRKQRFADSVELFQQLLTVDPDDLTAAMFMQSAMKYLQEGVPENWAGVVEMATK
jgi:adenylate cyclase